MSIWLGTVSLLYALIGLAPAEASANPCDAFVKRVADLYDLEGELFYVRKKFRFEVEDLDNDFSFSATVVNGRLNIDAQLARVDEGVRSHKRGRDLFKEMMDHFKSKKTQINEIHGRWTEGDNFDKFMVNRKAGMPPKSAARDTWTGRQAARFGFTQVAVEASQNATTGKVSVLAVFRRANSKLQYVKSKRVNKHVDGQQFRVEDANSQFYYEADIDPDGVIDIRTSLTDEVKGMRSDNDAALKTWTGRQAQRHGYSVIRQKILKMEDEGERVYTVIFEKP